MSITSSNAIVMLTVAGLYETAQRIQGFAADQVFTSEDVALAETVMGVDGRMTGGLVLSAVPWTVSLLADSPSNKVFEDWVAAQRKTGDYYKANCIVTLTGLNRKYIMTNGILSSGPGMPSAGKTIKDRVYKIMWERVEAQAI